MRTPTVNSTRQPSLTAAVLEQLGGDSDETRNTLREVAEHSADAGWTGFTYYSDTLAFFAANKAAIIARLKEDGVEFGQDPLAIVAGFGCLKGLKLSHTDIAEAIYRPGESEHFQTVRNALAWYALEEIARELNPDL